MSKFAQKHAVLYKQEIRVAAHLGGHLRRGPPPVTLRLHTAQWHSGKPPSSTERFTADTAHSIPDTFADTYYYAGERDVKLGADIDTHTDIPTHDHFRSFNFWTSG